MLLVSEFILINVALAIAASHYLPLFYEQARLSDTAAEKVKELLPPGNDLASMCSWADHVKFYLPWSSALHYIDTPDNLCTYQYESKLLSHNSPFPLEDFSMLFGSVL